MLSLNFTKSFVLKKLSLIDFIYSIFRVLNVHTYEIQLEFVSHFNS